MAAFPRTYRIVRSGQVQTATVHDADELFTLRAELELTLRFGAGANERVLQALDERMSRLHAEGTGDVGSAIVQLADMRSILVDGMAPANLMAARQIDADFPTLTGALDMDEIKNESDQFHQDVAAEISVSGVPDADALAEAFAEATADAGDHADLPAEQDEVGPQPLEGVSMEPLPMSVPDAASPAETAAQAAETNLAAAEDLLAQIEAGQDLLAAVAESATSQGEPTAPATENPPDAASAQSAKTTASAFSDVQDELAALSESLSTTADELGALTSSVAATVGVPDMTAAADADLAAAMADMMTPLADTPEPITESVAAPVVDTPAGDPIPGSETSEAAVDAALDATLAEALNASSETGGKPAADLSPAVEEISAPITSATTQNAPTQESITGPSSDPGTQTAETAPAQGDALADLLESMGTSEEDPVQAQAFAALLQEPAPAPDAGMAAMAAETASLTSATGPALTPEVPQAAVTAEQLPASPAAATSQREAPASQGNTPQSRCLAQTEPHMTVSPGQLATPQASPAGKDAAPAPAPAHAEGVDADNFRCQLDEVKNTLVSQIDRLGNLFENVARIHEQSQQTLAKTLELKQATDQAFDASRHFADAFAQAELARTACQQAEAQVTAARLRWETAQQNVAAAARGVTLPPKAPKRSSRKRASGG